MHHALLNLASWTFFRFSLIIVEPKKAPIDDKPTTNRKAGSFTAHSLDGNHSWMGLELSKKGWDILRKYWQEVVGCTHQEHSPGSIVYEDEGCCQQHCPTQSFITGFLILMLVNWSPLEGGTYHVCWSCRASSGQGVWFKYGIWKLVISRLFM